MATIKLLKISRKKSLDNIQQTPTPTEGSMTSSIKVSDPLKKPPLNPLMTQTENAMKQFQFTRRSRLSDSI